MPVTSLLFDIGNVLVTFDFSLAARGFAERCRLPAEEIIRRIEPLKAPLESGQMGDDEFVRQGMELIGFAGEPGEFTRSWCEIFAVNEPMESLLARLPAGLPRHLLSNTSGLHKEHLFTEFPVFSRFGSGVYSHLAGCMKPDEKIFRLAIEELRLDPASTLFIDDLPPNIAAAERLGFRCHHYSLEDHASLEARLRKEGLLDGSS